MKNHIKELKKKAFKIREKLVHLHGKACTSHIGSAFSSIELLLSLYFEIMNLEEDRFILSKGHGVSALYMVMVMKNIIPEDYLDCYCTDGGILAGHPDRIKVPGIFASTGSLGHGLSIGTGYAAGQKMDKEKGRTFVLLSDGELQEGSVWEAAHVAARLKLDNLVAIVDANRLQAFERTDNIIPAITFKPKWKAFGWKTKKINGHNFKEIIKTLKSVPFKAGKPSVIIASTIKGRGIKTFEDKLEWHYRSPKEEDMGKYFSELKEV